MLGPIDLDILCWTTYKDANNRQRHVAQAKITYIVENPCELWVNVTSVNSFFVHSNVQNQPLGLSDASHQPPIIDKSSNTSCPTLNPTMTILVRFGKAAWIPYTGTNLYVDNSVWKPLLKYSATATEFTEVNLKLRLYEPEYGGVMSFSQPFNVTLIDCNNHISINKTMINALYSNTVDLATSLTSVTFISSSAWTTDNPSICPIQQMNLTYINGTSLPLQDNCIKREPPDLNLKYSGKFCDE